ncbi:MAG: DUF4382 domain-containing protein [Euryarchaeota archaeon]|nr:DUF4382 domain-containing protein [Euryarchaeota archaeon]MDE1836175.1 DUF4382 domain-containing protein [Euryarchaeota archaeon]MDE1881861.1 DUF4382 domain-containing protein [Euryarchaeota archaeon]MDE2045462.1 DUF4382 domain-containing protein [Thermoplasmata archaeon]
MSEIGSSPPGSPLSAGPAPPLRPPPSQGRRKKLGIVVGVVVVIASVGLAGAWYMGLFAGSGTVAMYIHDAPCVCTHVYVTFTQVQVHKANGTMMGSGGWFVISSSAQTWDLLRLNGSALETLLASANVPAGHYTMVQLTVQNVTVDTVAGASIVAEVPNSSVHIEGPFDITAGSTTTLTLDVNLGTSLHVNANGTAVFTPNIALVVGSR